VGSSRWIEIRLGFPEFAEKVFLSELTKPQILCLFDHEGIAVRLFPFPFLMFSGAYEPCRSLILLSRGLFQVVLRPPRGHWNTLTPAHLNSELNALFTFLLVGGFSVYSFSPVSLSVLGICSYVFSASPCRVLNSPLGYVAAL
jgi:hypothetical protein